MSEDNCPYCGTRLIETNWGRRWCPNHGVIEEEKKEEYKYDVDKYKGYIG